MGEVIAFPDRRAHHRFAEPQAAQQVPPERTPLRAFVPATGPSGPRPAATREPLWREVTGAVLRDERRRQQRTLGDVAGRAGMSTQYLSEVERGRKEASSEMLAAACGSLGLGLAEFARRCASMLTSVAARPTGPVLLAA
jgi:hypothetical protein